MRITLHSFPFKMLARGPAYPDGEHNVQLRCHDCERDEGGVETT